MFLARVLKPGSVAVDIPGVAPRILFGRLGRMLEADAGVPAEAIADALHAREQQGSTAVGNGVAIPHAEVPGLKAPLAAVLRLAAPVDWHAFDRLPVDIVIALIGPTDEEGSAHLKRLAEVSRMVRDPEMRAKLRGSDRPASLHALLAGMAEAA